MGIKDLNQYILKHCTANSIKKLQFNDIKRKIVVVDISIYLYKFMSDGNFMEHLYTFLSLFKYYIVTPIFIFDGKPPPEKWALLKKRRWEKKDAEIRFLEIQDSIDSHTVEISADLQKEMDDLRKKMVRIKQEDMLKTKELLDAFGYVYYDAPGEADVLCAYLVKSGKAWACLSDDMDMFLYGCPRVLRNLSLMKHKIVLYDTEAILHDLGVNYSDFLEITVLCGTDYNDSSLSLCKTFEMHNEYMKIENIQEEPFNQWLIKRNNYPEQNISEICGYFDISKNTVLDIFEERIKIDILEKQLSLPKIKEIMGEYGFLFA
jgi:5'-3' exonuclease